MFETKHHLKPVVNHVKFIGCIVYTLTLSQEREKFHENGEKLIFIDYIDESKGYFLVL